MATAVTRDPWDVIPAITPAREVQRSVHMPGLRAASIVIVEALEADLGPRMELWGSHAGRPVLFEVDGGTGHEMLADLDTGDHPTAILEPGQVLLEALD